MMKHIVIAFLCIALIACKDEKRIPDVSDIRVDLTVSRFEQDFFSLDLNNLDSSLDRLYKKDPAFFQDYFSIMSFQNTDTALYYIPMFIKDSLYNKVYKDVQARFGSLDEAKRSITRGLQFVKYHFPQYQVQKGIVSFVGPIDGMATLITSDNRFAIGLQAYMGKDYPAYHTAYIKSVYPEYKSRKFSPEYIPVNCMMNVINEIYPAQPGGKPLVEQMVEAGKRLYVLEQLLPELDDTLITGYTKAQLDAAYKNESNIWGHLVTGNMLYNTDPAILRDYMNEAPFTADLGPGSIPFAGHFIGWQIVKKWMDGNDKSLEELLKTPARQLFEAAKYKPV